MAHRGARPRSLLASSGALRTSVRADTGRLLTVKLLGMAGEGAFQAGMGALVLFSPERATTPGEIALGFAVLLLPYSVLGPFAGALLDRWDRRRVLTGANLARAAIALAATAALATAAPTAVLLVLALVSVAISRFVAAGVSAALPRTVPADRLVATNSVFVTSGAVATSLGASAALTLLGLAGATDRAAAAPVTAAAVLSAAAALWALRFAPGLLGPDPDSGPGGDGESALRAVAAGLRAGASAVWHAPTVTGVLIAIGAHRIAFGVDTLILVLVLRETDDGAAGIIGFGTTVAVAAAGMFLAAVLTPLLLRTRRRIPVVLGALAVAAAVQIAVLPVLSTPALLVGAFGLGCAGQVVKLTGDVAMQTDVPDHRRGQVFSLQDTVFNLAFVAALAAAAAVVPADGHAPGLIAAMGLCHLAAIAVVAVNSRLRPDPAAQTR